MSATRLRHAALVVIAAFLCAMSAASASPRVLVRSVSAPAGVLEVVGRAPRCAVRVSVLVDGHPRGRLVVRGRRSRAYRVPGRLAGGRHRVTLRIRGCRFVLDRLRVVHRASNPFAGARFYVDPSSNAARTERAWRAAGRIADADAMDKIARNSWASWFGDWDGANPAADVRDLERRARAAGALPVLVAYNIPSRDCGGYSAGGARTAAAYRRWIDGFAGALHGRAAVVLEPDAVPELDCLDSAGRATTLSLLRYAVGVLSSRPGVAVYIDAGNAGWQTPATIARRLEQAGIARARGFSLNVSNFDTTASEAAYGHAISSRVGGKPFVIDTSRNGRGPAPGDAWCNPAGRGLGRPSTAATGDPLIDAFLWVKAPGESDGTCNGGPTAGDWWPAYALGLAQRAAF